jgi:hypothetical protein
MLILSKIRTQFIAAFALALGFIVLALRAHAEAPTIDHGSFPSPDGHFALEVGGFFDHDFHYAIKNQKTGDLQNLVEPKFILWGPLYAVDWTRDSKSVLLVYHVADGSEASILRFDGKAWHELAVAPTPVESKCHGDEGYNATIFDHRAATHDFWISYGIQTDLSHRHTLLYVCNFDDDPATGTLSHVTLHHVTTPTYRRLKAVHDYSENPYPLAQ